MDQAVINATEPSIGQLEYLKYLRAMSAVQKPTFMLVELELPLMDDAAVEKTLRFFLERHDSLRTVFPMVGNEIKQLVLPLTDKKFQPEYVNVEGVDDREFYQIRMEHFSNAAAVFADIEHGPLVKLLLFRSTKRCRLSLLLHHVICDEWSRILIKHELTIIYRSYLSGNEPALPSLTVKLQDYCEQQNKWLYQNKPKLSAFWKHKLEGFNTSFETAGYQKMYAHKKNGMLPALKKHDLLTVTELSAILDRPDACSYTSIVCGPLFRDVKSVTVAQKGTLSSLVYASLFLLLHVYTGKKRILMPLLMADRYLPEYQQLIGCLLGSMYLPVTIDDHSTISDFVKAIDDEIRTVIVNRQMIFSHNFLKLDGDQIRNCCDMYVNYFRKAQDLSAEQPVFEQHIEVGAIHYPMYVMVTEHNDALSFCWKYNKYLFNREIIENMVTCHKELLQYMVSNSSNTISGMAGDYRMEALIS